MASEELKRQLTLTATQLGVNINHERRIRELESVVRWQSWWLAVLMVAVAAVAFARV